MTEFWLLIGIAIVMGVLSGLLVSVVTLLFRGRR